MSRVKSETIMKKNQISLEQAEHFSRVALAGLHRAWPYKIGYVYESEKSVRPPREHHPVFFGHFDWHSSVHGHWTLVRLLKLFPNHARAEETRAALKKSFTHDALAAEAQFLKENPSFERMYGWAWAMRLGQELLTWDDDDGRNWASFYKPVEDEIAKHFTAYMAKIDWPVRCGFHPESAFPLAQFFDWAKATNHELILKQVTDQALAFYEKDRNYPIAYEPSGQDFFSPCLNVADLMRRVMPAPMFLSWLDEYLPGLRGGKLGNLLVPATVSDFSDGQIVHLVGLNLSRAWTMFGVASTMEPTDARRIVLEKSAAMHTTEGLKYVDTGNYEGDHWLASFAVYLLSAVGVKE